MQSLITHTLITLLSLAMLVALSGVIRDAFRQSEPSGRKEARVIKEMCKRPGAWGDKK